MIENEIIKNLSTAYGIQIPRDFASVILHICENASLADEDFGEYFDFMFEFWFSDKILTGETVEDANDYGYFGYNTVPIEFFHFAGTGVAGIALGFVIHAPEIEVSDYPIGEFYPAGSGVYCLGETTRNAFEFMLARSLQWNSVEYKTKHYGEEVSDKTLNCFKLAEEEARQKIFALSKLLNVNPNTIVIPENYGNRQIVPKIPQDWRFEATQDGIGVLAHQSKFSPIFNYSQVPKFNDLDEELKFIKQILQQGFPATALWIIREKYFTGSFERPFAEIAELWAKIYEALNRPLLAKRVFEALEFRNYN